MSQPQTTKVVDCPLNLRVGEWVEVKGPEEILATLDGEQSVSGMPFMPEMLQHCGKRFRVCASAHKTADTIELFTIRRLANAVHLKELRCDGASHGGCQAGCLIFWKECWLKRVPGDPVVEKYAVAESDAHEAKVNRAVNCARLQEGTRCSLADGKTERYRCQATEVLKATREVRRRHRWDPRFYVRDLTSGNVNLIDFIRFGAFAMLNAFLLRWFGWRFPRVRGLAEGKTPTCNLNLQPGELVSVKTKAEIAKTINNKFRNRGLWFDVEMVPYCGKGRFRVLRRVEKILNEKTGEMMKLPNPCIILEGVTCSGNYLHGRMFSRRHEYLYWREIWLKRDDAVVDDVISG